MFATWLCFLSVSVWLFQPMLAERPSPAWTVIFLFGFHFFSVSCFLQKRSLTITNLSITTLIHSWLLCNCVILVVSLLLSHKRGPKPPVTCRSSRLAPQTPPLPYPFIPPSTHPSFLFISPSRGGLILVGPRPGKLFFPLQAKQLAPLSPSTSRLVHFSFIILLRGTQPEPSCFLCPPHFPCVGYIFLSLIVG